MLSRRAALLPFLLCLGWAARPAGAQDETGSASRAQPAKPVGSTDETGDALPIGEANSPGTGGNGPSEGGGTALGGTDLGGPRVGPARPPRSGPPGSPARAVREGQTPSGLTQPPPPFTPAGTFPGDLPSSSPETSSELKRTGSDAIKKATDLGERLKKTLTPDQPGPQGKDPGPRTKGEGPDQGPPKDLASPKTPQELALSSLAGFGETARSLGLKVGSAADGTPLLVRADGSAATGPDLERLRDAIGREPAALLRRPDFFQVLPRERFVGLKEDFDDPALRDWAFKDIALTDGRRDFVHSASCDRVSGDCNPLVKSQSYKKGKEVAPEDLDAIWNRLKTEARARLKPAKDDPESERRARELARAKKYLGTSVFGAGGASGFLDRMGGLFGGIKSMLGLGDDGAVLAAAGPASAPGDAAAAGVPRFEAGPVGPPSSRPSVRDGPTRGLGVETSRGPDRTTGLPPEPTAPARAPSRPRHLGVIVLTATAGLLWLWLTFGRRERRRRLGVGG